MFIIGGAPLKSFAFLDIAMSITCFQNLKDDEDRIRPHSKLDSN